MDPDVTLFRLRLALVAARKQGTGNVSGQTADEIVDMAEALDEWISSGGFLPEDWKKGRVDG